MSLTLEDCGKIIQRYTHGNCVAISFEMMPLSATPVGFLGEHFRLRITYSSPQSGHQRHRTAHFFLKMAPTRSATFSRYVAELGAFRKETMVYQQLLADFQQLHAEPLAARSFLTDGARGLLVLEDLAARGFKMASTTRHQMTLLMRTLARFHASTVVYEERRSLRGRPYRLLDHFADELAETSFSAVPGAARNRWAATTARAVVDAMLLLMPDVSAHQLVGDAFQRFVHEEIFDYVRPSTRYRNVVNHADLWQNNALFRDDACVLVDFQLVRYAPPVLDVLTALHVNCMTSELKEHKTHLLDVYYRTFADALARHGIPTEAVFGTQREFDESLAYFEVASLTEAAMFGTIVFVGEELAQKLATDETVFNEFYYANRSKYVLDEMRTNANFAARLTDILNRLIECFLKRNSHT